MDTADLCLESYAYDIPPDLVAQRPATPREESRLLVWRHPQRTVEHRRFLELADVIPQGSLLALNQSGVFPSRLRGRKSSGGKCEVMLLSLQERGGLHPCLVRTSGRKTLGERYHFRCGLSATLREIRTDGTFGLAFDGTVLAQWLELHGETPLPPYIRQGMGDQRDLRDYQTTYAKDYGSVAAPTAGLHFGPRVFERLAAKGIELAFVTLHVGPGTFSPVKEKDIREHRMHREVFWVEPGEQQKLRQARAEGRRIYAVGTTTLRVLEHQMIHGEGKGVQDTDLFLYPGRPVASVDGLITNFHRPCSSLLMLVSALVGRQTILSLYHQAIRQRYRFFSYGDAMLLETGRPQ